jgi:hypothetical protein
MPGTKRKKEDGEKKKKKQGSVDIFLAILQWEEA